MGRSRSGSATCARRWRVSRALVAAHVLRAARLACFPALRGKTRHLRGSRAATCHLEGLSTSRRRTLRRRVGPRPTSVRGGSGAQLGEETLRRLLVVAPADDLGAVPDAVVGGVVEGDLDDELGAQVDPFELAGVVPARRVAHAALAGLVGGELGGQLALLGGLEAGRVADDAELAVGVVQAEDQGADGALLFARAPAHDDRVDRADALDLGHADPLSGLV